jgi:hypothetical protein
MSEEKDDANEPQDVCARCCDSDRRVERRNGAMRSGVRVLWRRLSACLSVGIWEPGIRRSIRRGVGGRERLCGRGSRWRGCRRSDRDGYRHRCRHGQRSIGRGNAGGVCSWVSLVQRLLLPQSVSRTRLRKGSLLLGTLNRDDHPPAPIAFAAPEPPLKIEDGQVRRQPYALLQTARRYQLAMAADTLDPDEITGA